METSNLSSINTSNDNTTLYIIIGVVVLLLVVGVVYYMYFYKKEEPTQKEGIEEFLTKFFKKESIATRYYMQANKTQVNIEGKFPSKYNYEESSNTPPGRINGEVVLPSEFIDELKKIEFSLCGNNNIVWSKKYSEKVTFGDITISSMPYIIYKITQLIYLSDKDKDNNIDTVAKLAIIAISYQSLVKGYKSTDVIEYDPATKEVILKNEIYDSWSTENILTENEKTSKKMSIDRFVKVLLKIFNEFKPPEFKEHFNKQTKEQICSSGPAIA